ncbi:MAG: DUF4304 domain-containing protein [Blastocatellales bacterium]|nr:DUF4304 domain-containing protein [Blastocatellales bacterium]
MSSEFLQPSQVFTKLLSNAVTPALKTRGWARKQQTFFLKKGENWGIINFQKSRRSSKDKIIFTINIGVASGLLLRFLSGKKDNEKPKLSDCHWKCRIGILLPGKEDKWWIIDTNTAPESLDGEILGCLTDLAVPEIETYLSDDSLKDLWLSGCSPSLTEFQRLVYLSVLLKTLGPHDLLQSIIQKLRHISESDPESFAVTYYLGKLERINQ